MTSFRLPSFDKLRPADIQARLSQVGHDRWCVWGLDGPFGVERCDVGAAWAAYAWQVRRPRPVGGRQPPVHGSRAVDGARRCAVV